MSWAQTLRRSQLSEISEMKRINSHAGGMAVARPYGFEIDFLRNPFSVSTSWFFVIILKVIFTPIFVIKIYAEKFFDTKRISFSKSDFLTPKISFLKTHFHKLTDSCNHASVEVNSSFNFSWFFLILHSNLSEKAILRLNIRRHSI